MEEKIFDILSIKKISKCEHNIQKYSCRICHPKAFCEHDKEKRYCKECFGNGYCEHGNRKRICKECGGIDLCEHKKIKATCNKCIGNKICEHGINKYYCKNCEGDGICEHGIKKTYCDECGGAGLCKHNKKKYDCKICKGSSICEHDKFKTYCKICKGSAICEHNKIKTRCKTCGGSSLCKSEWCERNKNNKYEGYCLFCFVHLYPDNEIVRNYKTKERDVVDRIQKIYQDFTWVHDKKIQDGCSLKRPDLLLDLGSHIIIIEVDENAHSDYDCSCENKRLMLLSQDVGHRSIVFIRFNPDSYINKDGNKIKSCWKINNKTGLLTIDPKKISEWEERINILIEQIKYWVENPSDKMIEIIQLFYS